jgi:hypothetical protein
VVPARPESGGTRLPPPGPRAEAPEAAVLNDWRTAEAGSAVRLARVAGRIDVLDDRLKCGPVGWRHRLALIKAADLSRFVGVRFGLTDWRSGAEPFVDRAESWLDLAAQAGDLHPITRACVGFHLWSLAGLGKQSDPMEAAVTAARIAAGEGMGVAVAPLAMGGAGGCMAAAFRSSGWSAGLKGWRPRALPPCGTSTISGLGQAGRGRDGPAFGGRLLQPCALYLLSGL